MRLVGEKQDIKFHQIMSNVYTHQVHFRKFKMSLKKVAQVKMIQKVKFLLPETD